MRVETEEGQASWNYLSIFSLF